MAELILIILGLSHILLSIFGAIAIKKTFLFDSQKKRLNIILIWAIPFIWFILIKQILKQTSNDTKKKGSKSNFYESEKGFYGDL